MRDGVELESRGIPTAVIITKAFETEAEVQRAALGMMDLRPVLITHPLSTISAEEIRRRAEEAVPQIRSILTANGG